MPTLRIEHSVANYDAWKTAFDSDPADRKGHGVRSYQISRAVDDPSLVMIDLDFETQDGAEDLLAVMRSVWAGPGKDVMRNPQARIVDRQQRVQL
jgi:hypothetical protein